MTDERSRSMEDQARELADDLTKSVETMRRLRDLGRADSAADQLEEELAERPYGISTTIVVEVELYGGGPAGGVWFYCERGKYELELNHATAWHQDWFEPKGWCRLSDDIADELFNAWGIAYHGGEMS